MEQEEENRRNLQDEMLFLANYLVEHQPQPGMLWVIVECMKSVADITTWIEDIKHQEHDPDSR